MDIVVVCNKKDFFLAKILVASIRFFQPGVAIYLVKDLLNGNFNTSNLQAYYGVSILDLGISRYGWCAAKIKLLLAEQLPVKKFLMLDADIVFLGNFLESLQQINADFIVSPQYTSDVDSNWFRKTFYDAEWVKQKIPDLAYPGFVFNCGQMVVTAGIIKQEDVEDYISFNAFPYWTDKAFKHLPCRDQSLLNFLLPYKHQTKELVLSKQKMMIWPKSEEAASITLDGVLNNRHPYLLHWAGLKRTSALQHMAHADILFFFKRQYYKPLRAGKIRYHLDNWFQTIQYHLIGQLRKLRSIVKR